MSGQFSQIQCYKNILAVGTRVSCRITSACISRLVPTSYFTKVFWEKTPLYINKDIHHMVKEFVACKLKLQTWLMAW